MRGSKSDPVGISEVVWAGAGHAAVRRPGGAGGLRRNTEGAGADREWSWRRRADRNRKNKPESVYKRSDMYPESWTHIYELS